MYEEIPFNSGDVTSVILNNHHMSRGTITSCFVYNLDLLRLDLTAWEPAIAGSIPNRTRVSRPMGREERFVFRERL
jgi:hypothetical protein